MPDPIFFIEPYAHESWGHAPANLVALSAAAVVEGLEPFVVLSHSPPPDIRAELSAAGANVIVGSRFCSLSLRILHSLEARLKRLVARSARNRPEATWPYQTRLFVRALWEAVAVRAARSIRHDGVIVILTASDVLVGFSCYLARHHHIRVVHDVHHYEGRIVRAAERACSAGRARMLMSCPTEAVADAVSHRYPDVAPKVRPFAVVVPGQRITADERVAARRQLGLAPDDVVAVLIGGWNSEKDPLTALKGLSRARTRLVVIVAGYPIDAELALNFETSTCRVVPIVGPVPRAALRSIYAAATFSVVSRIAGVATESGLVLDVAKLGVPLLMSDNDPALVQRVACAPWVTVFSAGNPSSLARAVDELDFPLPPPPDTAPALLGMLTSSEMMQVLRELAPSDVRPTGLRSSCPGRHRG